MSDILLTKLLLGPGLVVAASLAGRRWGPAVSGILVAIPIVLGPILLIITIEQGETFGAEAATSSLLALVALAVYVVAFERTGRSRRWEIATLAGWAAFLAVALVLSQIDASPIVALCVARPARATASAPKRPRRRRWRAVSLRTKTGSRGQPRVRPSRVPQPHWSGSAGRSRSQALVGQGIQTLVAPDADRRKEPRPGRRGGLYDFTRRVLTTAWGKEVYRKRQGTVEPVFGQIKTNRAQLLLTPRQISRQIRVAAAGRHSQPPQAPQAPTRPNLTRGARPEPGGQPGRAGPPQHHPPRT